MNKQELIKKYEEKYPTVTMDIAILNYFKELWNDIKNLDEPQKPVVKQFIANWYEQHKYNFEFSVWDYVYRFDQQEETSFKKWFNGPNTKPFQTLVNMHQFGYELEKEKKYRFSLKNGQPLLKTILGENFYFSQDIAIESCKVTRKQLEDAGFGWVFDCEGIEIEEVQDDSKV